MLRRIAACCLSAALAFGAAAAVRAAPGDVRPAGSNQPLAPAMTAIDVDEHLGLEVDRGLSFRDHEGKQVTIGDYLDGKRPVLITLNYYRCPVLCNVQLNELTETLRQLEWTAGDQNFRIVTVSIDPRETPEIAGPKRAAHLQALGRGDDVDWAFLTGDTLNIRLLAAQLGVSYVYDPEQDQYAHPAVIAFLSPEGKIARYVYGLSYAANDLKFALIEASEGRVGSTIDRLILSCFHYDATLGRYGPFAFGLMRIAGAVSVLLIGTALFVYRRRERQVTA
jgi:protein SCO1/2